MVSVDWTRSVTESYGAMCLILVITRRYFKKSHKFTGEGFFPKGSIFERIHFLPICCPILVVVNFVWMTNITISDLWGKLQRSWHYLGMIIFKGSNSIQWSFVFSQKCDKTIWKFRVTTFNTRYHVMDIT